MQLVRAALDSFPAVSLITTTGDRLTLDRKAAVNLKHRLEMDCERCQQGDQRHNALPPARQRLRGRS